MNRSRHPLRALSLLRLPGRRCSAVPDVDPPLRIHRTSTSVLEAIATTAPRPPVHPQLLPQDPMLVRGSTARLSNLMHLMKLNGKQSARYFLNNFPDEFSTLNHEAPVVHAFRPRHCVEDLIAGEASDEALSRLVSLCALDHAWDMYESMDKAQVSSETRLRLLDLLCAFNSRSKALLDTDPIAIYVGKAPPGIVQDVVFKQHEKSTWSADGRAEQLFETLEGEERGPGFRAMIRGLSKYGEYERALQMHRQMREEGFVGNRDSYTAALRCVHTVKYRRWKTDDKVMFEWPMRSGLDLLYEMRETGIKPDVETFNAFLYSISFATISNDIRPNTAFNCFVSIIKEMEALGIPPNLGTLTNVLRLGHNWEESLGAINRTLIDDGQIPMKTNKRQLRFYAALVQHVIDRLSQDKGRKRFETEYDLETLFLIRTAKMQMFSPREMMLTLHRLLRDSPSLCINSRLSIFYFANVLESLIKVKPADAMEVFERERHTTAGLWDSIRRNLYILYAEHNPQRLESLLEADIHVLTLRWFSDHDDSTFFNNLAAVVETQPQSRPHVVRALNYLKERMKTDELKAVNASQLSTLLPILLPTDLNEQVDEDTLELANFFHDLRSDTVAVEAVLSLGHALLKAGRTEQAMDVLNTMMKKKTMLMMNLKFKRHCNAMIEALVQTPEVMANTALHQRLVDHQTGKTLFEPMRKQPAKKDVAKYDSKKPVKKQRSVKDKEWIQTMMKQIRNDKEEGGKVGSRPRTPWKRQKDVANDDSKEPVKNQRSVENKEWIQTMLKEDGGKVGSRPRTPWKRHNKKGKPRDADSSSSSSDED